MNCMICLKTINQVAKHSNYHDKCYKKLFGSLSVDPILPFSRADFFQRKSSTNTKNMSMSGVQPKLGVKIEGGKLQVSNKDFTYILKPSPEEYPELSQVEHLCMNISRLLKIETAENGLVKFADGDIAYLTKRFDKVAEKNIHQEDMMQAMNIHPDLVSNGKYAARSYEDVAMFLQSHSSIVIAKNLFERVFLNFMLANDDYHLKNISIQFDKKFPGGFHLTPHYDCVMTKLYIEGDKELACDLLSTEDGYSPYFNILGFHSKYCFDFFGKRILLPENVLKKVYEKFYRSGKDMTSLVRSSYLSQERQEKFCFYLKDRLEKFNRIIPDEYLKEIN